jgi:hypothetical protein
VDASSNVYVTGASGEGSQNLSDFVTIKYNPSGVEQWVGRYSDWYDYATAIAVDASANVYVTGYSYNLGTYYDYATVKYNTSGVQQWVSRYNGPGTSDDYPNAITIDGSGNIYVTGEAFFSPGSGSDYATIKYSPSGVQQWVARYDGPGNTVDVANDVEVDGMGNVYVTGESRDAGTEDDFATIKYNASGVEQCIVRYNGPENAFDLAAGLAVDASGNVYVTGRSAFTGGSIITTIKYEPVPVSVEEQNSGIPSEFSLEQNYPNPFNSRTVFSFQLPVFSEVRILVYDVLGREIATLLDEEFKLGIYRVDFDGTNYPSGVYFYRLEAGSFSDTKKLLLLR